MTKTIHSHSTKSELQTERISINDVEFDILVRFPSSVMKKRIEQEINILKKNYSIPGFRSGKVPPSMIPTQQYEAAKKKAKDEVLEKGIQTALIRHISKEEESRLFGKPYILDLETDCDANPQISCRIACAITPQLETIQYPESMVRFVSNQETSQSDLEALLMDMRLNALRASESPNSHHHICSSEHHHHDDHTHDQNCTASEWNDALTLDLEVYHPNRTLIGFKKNMSLLLSNHPCTKSYGFEHFIGKHLNTSYTVEYEADCCFIYCILLGHQFVGTNSFNALSTGSMPVVLEFKIKKIEKPFDTDDESVIDYVMKTYPDLHKKYKQDSLESDESKSPPLKSASASNPESEEQQTIENNPSEQKPSMDQMKEIIRLYHEDEGLHLFKCLNAYQALVEMAYYHIQNLPDRWIEHEISIFFSRSGIDPHGDEAHQKKKPIYAYLARRYRLIAFIQNLPDSIINQGLSFDHPDIHSIIKNTYLLESSEIFSLFSQDEKSKSNPENIQHRLNLSQAMINLLRQCEEKISDWQDRLIPARHISDVIQ